jgi:hypothetical protein
MDLRAEREPDVGICEGECDFKLPYGNLASYFVFILNYLVLNIF